MSFQLDVQPPPLVSDPVLTRYLRQQHTALLFLLKQMNNPGCGLGFDGNGRLSVLHDDETTVCASLTHIVKVDAGAVRGSDAESSARFFFFY